MDPQIQSFFKKIPDAWSEVLSVVVGYGFVPTLVGGTVRDYFLNQTVGKDWDIEISHPTLSFNPDQWKAFGKGLAGVGKTTLLPYDIIRLDHKSYQFEFSPQRQEIFHESPSHHKNFEARYEFNVPYQVAALRRDFTINALGIDLKNKVLLDPFEGLRHLRENSLVPCGEDFAKDPVRFLRALRFSVLLKMELSSHLKELLSKMDLSYLSFHYIWSEMKKSQDPLKFYLRLQAEQDNHPELKLPLKNSLTDFEVQDPYSQDSWLLSLNWWGLDALAWEKFFNLSPDQGKKLKRWTEISKALNGFDVDLLQGEFENIHPKKEFQLVFDWYFSTKQILQKTPESPLLPFIQKHLQGWSYLLTFDLVKDVKHIDPPLRAKYQVWSLCQRI